MKSNSSNFSFSIIAAVLSSVWTAFGQTNTTGTNFAVTITAPDPSASEAGDPGLFSVSRGTNTTGNLLVFLQISGSALNGTDYQAISNRVLIADGATSASFAVTPIDDASPEPTESVVARVILPPAGFVSYRIGSPSTATVSITDDDGFVETNHPPVVNIVQPMTNTTFVAPATIPIRARAQDSDGMVVTVEFFANNQSLGFGTSTNPAGAASSEFFLTWSNVQAGVYDLTAKATDDDGAMAFSPAAHIFVGTNQPPPPPTNQLPVVNIVQPTNGAFFLAQANISIRAFAQDFDGFVASVEFFANNQSLGLGSNIDPNGTVGTNYFLTWSNVPPGAYDLTAKATDDDGAMRISTTRHIFVGTNQPPPPTNQPPVVNIVQPSNNAAFLAPANILIRAGALDFDGFVASVEFFANNQSLGFGRTTNFAGTVNSAFFLTWSNVPPGVYDLTAKATDDDGAMRLSQVVHIFVGTNQPPPPPTNQLPVVNIVQPTNGAVFPASANIALRAFAEDQDGMVASVEFFANSQSLGFGSNVDPNGTLGSQYSLTWSNVAQSSYDLTAQAIDDDGENSFSQVVHIVVGTPPPPTNRPPIVNILQPTNGAFFPAPANIFIRASARDTNGFVASVEFFANNQSLGFGTSTNATGALNKTFLLTWSNVPPSAYDLTAKATDNEGAMTISSLVHITVGTNQPPFVDIVQPTNSAFFFAPANIPIRASAQDFDGFVASVEFFANNQSLGFGRSTNSAGTVSSQFFLTWSNVPPGAYDLTAKATDDDGAMRISTARHIFVGTNQPPPPTNHPPLVRLLQPQDGARFAAPAVIGLVAEAQDFDPFNFVFRVDFFANGTQIGQGMRNSTGSAVSNQWHFAWSNVVAGEYDLTAKATDNFGEMGFSLPVHIFVGTNQPPPPTNQLAVVNISATDPTASEGLVMWCSNTVMGVNWWGVTNGILQTNWPCPTGTNTATFTVRRTGGTNHSLNVYYSIGGSASNGVDYTGLPGVVTIPAGARTARIIVTPVDDNLREGIETVVLRLIPSHDPQANIPFVIGQPAIAAAYITDNDCPPPPCGLLADGTVHLCWPLTNQCFRVDLSTNLIDWVGVCTNRVADGAAHHLDPDATNCLRQFIRFVPVPCPPEGQ